MDLRGKKLKLLLETAVNSVEGSFFFNLVLGFLITDLMDDLEEII